MTGCRLPTEEKRDKIKVSTSGRLRDVEIRGYKEIEKERKRIIFLRKERKRKSQRKKEGKRKRKRE